MQSNFIGRSLRLVLFLLFGVTTTIAFSQSIKGKVLDAKTGEPLVGATVRLENSKRTVMVKLDGTFNFGKVEAGTYKLRVSYEGYKIGDVTTVEVIGTETKTVNLNLEPIASELSSVTITAGGKETDRGARRMEKLADPLLNVLSSKTIQLLPDITVANALQRVSGVTIEKSNSGEGRFPIIRGMEKRYINTLVNGIKIPSPDNRNRYIPLDLFPSELLERLEVSKSLTPSMEGDAIGGTINLVMKDAPSSLLLQANVATGFNNILSKQPYQKFDHSTINKKSPNEIRNDNNYNAVPSDFSVAHLNYTDKGMPLNTTLGLTVGNRFGRSKKFGFLLSGSYQNIYSGTQSTFFLPNAQPNINNVPNFSDLISRKYSSQSERIGLNGKLDYHINSRNKISLINTFVRLDNFQTRMLNDTIALNSLVDGKSRSSWQYQSIYNTTLQGEHILSGTLRLDWSLVYSIANNHIPDQAEFSHEYPVSATTTSSDNLQSLSHIWSHNSDQDYSAYVNLTKSTQIFGKKIELKLGGVTHTKTRDNFYQSYSLTPQLSSSSSVQPYTTINNAVWVFKGTNSGIPSITGNNYSFNESIDAGYVQGKLRLSNKLEALGGVRVEYTHQHYETQLGTEVAAKSGKIWYTDVLPSLQFKYDLTPKQAFRLAYYRALARPGFAELIPDGPAFFENFKEIGNPQTLNHSTADNIDLRYEFFPKAADQLLLGVFYKNIQNPIEFAAVKTGVSSQSLIPQNFGNATNYGFEAVYTKYFGIFGVSANYTYTKSKITTSKLYSYYDPTLGNTSKLIDETRPLQGQSNHIGNVSFLLKMPKLGLDVQTAFVYTGARIALVVPYYGLNYWQEPLTQLDFSLEKKIVKKLSFYTKINNLTNTPLALTIRQSYSNYLTTSGARALPLQTDVANKIFVQKDYFKTSFLFGLRFKL